MAATTIVVLEGDETGQELLEEALRVLAADVTGVEIELLRYDLTLEDGVRRRTVSCTRLRTPSETPAWA